MIIKDIEIRYTSLVKTKTKVNTPATVYEYMLPEIKGLAVERFYVLCLSSQLNVRYRQMISQGNIESAVVEPVSVFAFPVANMCNKIILCHNHPSGELNPSSEDIKTTARLLKGAEILGIQILDHIIMSDEGYFSFNGKGMMR